MSQYKFKLYITGDTLNSTRARAALRRLLEEGLIDPQDLIIIDVLAEPEQAEKDRIIATPTLIRTEPLPERRVIGDLSDLETVLSALWLTREDKPEA